MANEVMDLGPQKQTAVRYSYDDRAYLEQMPSGKWDVKAHYSLDVDELRKLKDCINEVLADSQTSKCLGRPLANTR